jgi:hypothetical protein
MANEVYANGMEVACKAGAGKSICAFPDVCFTPPQTPATPPGVPIPYPNTGLSSDTSDGSTSVTISGQEAMLKSKSYYKKSAGDEAGCAPKKGMINSKISGKVYFAAWSMDVKIEGENVDRHLDLTTHNHGSTANEALTWPNLEAVSLRGIPTKPCPQNCGPKTVSEARYQELRGYTASPRARKEVNKRVKRPKLCAVCKQSKRRLSADHIVSLKEITEIPGFACLSDEDQKKIADDTDNMVGMCRSCNSSKQEKQWDDWKEHKARDFKIPKSVSDKGKEVAAKSKPHLIKKIRQADCA